MAKTYKIKGKEYTSVTTPISVISYPYLEVWRQRIGRRAADKISSSSAAYGTRIHSYVEKLLLGKEFKPDPKCQKEVDLFKEWMDKHIDEVILSEATVYSDELGVAGTMDMLLKLRGHDFLTIGDLKTGKLKTKNLKLQLAAYKNLLLEGKLVNPKKIKLPISAAFAISLNKTTKEIKPKEIILTDHDWTAYKGLLTYYQWASTKAGKDD